MRAAPLVRALALVLPATALSRGMVRYPNCKALNARYPHGVGRVGARDHTRSGNPVTNFTRSNLLYRLNRGLTAIRTASPAKSISWRRTRMADTSALIE